MAPAMSALLEPFLRRSDPAHVERHRFAPADAGIAVGLDRPEQRALRLAGRSSSPLMNSVPPAACSSAPERHLAVALAAEQRGRRHPHRRLAATTMTNGSADAPGQAMQVARIGLAARAGLADQQHRRGAGGGLLHLFAQRLREPALADRHRERGRAFARSDSRLRRPASSARSTVRSSLASDSGFSTKSKAPRRVASTAVSTVPCPDIITTGQS